jgi:LPS export ABC transporter protein LptC
MRVHTMLVAALALHAAGCEERVRPAVAPVQQQELPSQESWNSTVVFSDSARVRARLRAGYIAVYSPQGYTLLSDSVTVDFYDEEERHTSVLTSRRGRVDDRTRDFAAYGSVRVRSDSGTVLTTDSLFWRNVDQTILTQAFVDILSPTEHITGHGLISDQSLKNYRIARVTGQTVTRE